MLGGMSVDATLLNKWMSLQRCANPAERIGDCNFKIPFQTATNFAACFARTRFPKMNGSKPLSTSTLPSETFATW